MARGRSRITLNMPMDNVEIKSESGSEYEPTTPQNKIKQESDGTIDSFRKRKRSPQYTAPALNDDDEELRQGLGLVDDFETEEKIEVARPAKKSTKSKYACVCAFYKAEMKAMADPRGSSEIVATTDYLRSMELNKYLYAEFDREHTDFVDIRRKRGVVNAKIRELKQAVKKFETEMQAGAAVADCLEKQVGKLNHELTLKVAKPLSEQMKATKIKVEKVDSEFFERIANLNGKLNNASADKRTAERLLSEARKQGDSFRSRLADTSAALERAEQDKCILRQQIARLEEEKRETEKQADTTDNALMRNMADTQIIQNTTQEEAKAVQISKEAEIRRLKLESTELRAELEKVTDERDEKENTIQFLRKKRVQDSAPTRT